MSDFADLRDGGRRLGDALASVMASLFDPVLVPVLPNGVPVVVGMRQVLNVPVVPLPVDRTSTGVVVPGVPALAGRTAIVVDDGVESGTVAFAAIDPLRASGVAALVLAVPVGPAATLSVLAGRYDQVVAVVQSPERRSLTEHYADFDTVDEAEARRLLDHLPA